MKKLPIIFSIIFIFVFITCFFSALQIQKSIDNQPDLSEKCADKRLEPTGNPGEYLVYVENENQLCYFFYGGISPIIYTIAYLPFLWSPYLMFLKYWGVLIGIIIYGVAGYIVGLIINKIRLMMISDDKLKQEKINLWEF